MPISYLDCAAVVKSDHQVRLVVLHPLSEDAFLTRSDETFHIGEGRRLNSVECSLYLQ